MPPFRALLPLLLAVPGPSQQPAPAPDLTVWPNAASRANSDPWLVAHHDELRRLEPRVLVLDFCNQRTPEQVRTQAEALIAALAESSRYHGYEDPQAPVFLQYRIERIVDLRDAEPRPQTADGNSTRMPKKPGQKSGFNFRYAALYSDEFAASYGYPDPDRAGRFLPLHELVARGIVHEVWIFASQGDAGWPFECTEQKPVYDEQLHRVGDEHRHCGNGGDLDEPWHGRSLRINYVNVDRGIGCAMENFGHALEHMATADVIPCYRRRFVEFAGLDLDRRFGQPFDSLYAVDAGGKDKAGYPDAHTMVVHHHGVDVRLEKYVAAGGNVHFPPNGRHDYDLDNAAPVLSTIEHWRRRDGEGGADATILFTPARFAKYRELAPDCMGPWLVYWRQNMPGLHNQSREDDGTPVKNWWPFLFY